MEVNPVNPLQGESADESIKEAVQSFYNQVGWQPMEGGLYQNASYEDLRPVSQEYIHRCHLRVMRHLKPAGKFLLDAGSGPIQYAEYLEYSRGYQNRVCADLSFVALREARMRIGDHGLFVVADIANLPFCSQVFDGVVSLHTIHHLPTPEHVPAYCELHRVLAVGAKAVVVNGWKNPPLMRVFNPVMRWLKKFQNRTSLREPSGVTPEALISETPVPDAPVQRGTFVSKYNATWVKRELGQHMPIQIYCWRSVSVPFLRAFIHNRLAGRWLLKILFILEELFPRFFGEQGQYPLVVIHRESK
jgi:SAM-dependent methyltransferase